MLVLVEIGLLVYLLLIVYCTCAETAIIVLMVDPKIEFLMPVSYRTLILANLATFCKIAQKQPQCYFWFKV